MTAQLVLVRHAYADDPDPKLWPDDSARPITKKGAKKFRKAAAGIAKLVVPERVLTSQYARCIQTANILTSDAGWPPAVAYDTLDNPHTPKDVIKDILALDEWPCIVGLVGHGPNFLELMSYLILGYGDIANGELDKGSAALIQVKPKMRAGSGQLAWTLTQKELKQHR